MEGQGITSRPPHQEEHASPWPPGALQTSVQRAWLRRQAGARKSIPIQRVSPFRGYKRKVIIDEPITRSLLLLWSPLNTSVWNRNSIPLCFYLVPRSHQGQWLSKCGPLTSTISCTWKLARNSHSQAPTQTHRIRNAGWVSAIRGLNTSQVTHTKVWEPLPPGTGRESQQMERTWVPEWPSGTEPLLPWTRPGLLWEKSVLCSVALESCLA